MGRKLGVLVVAAFLAALSSAALAQGPWSDGDLKSLNEDGKCQGCNLKGAPLAGFNSDNAFKINLQGADLRGAFLKGANLTGARLIGADLRGAVLREAHLQMDLDKKSTSLRGADLRGAIFVGANLKYARMEGSDWRGAFLKGALIEGADWTGANLTGAIWIDEKTCQRGSIGECITK